MEAMEIIRTLGAIMAGLGIFFAGLGIFFWGTRRNNKQRDAGLLGD